VITLVLVIFLFRNDRKPAVPARAHGEQALVPAPSAGPELS
jgi:hypothetical protein